MCTGNDRFSGNNRYSGLQGPDRFFRYIHRLLYWYRANTDVGIGIVPAQMWVSVLVSISTIKIFSIGTGIGIVKPKVGYRYRY